ncbi:anthranilate phosphoribosyltransferase [Thermus filiformis]|jgi:anthranilate phosphoribosyltransferase|uniref:Anthranilate phosphoribosyltransferase n=1 Tax=Thermus filiformis TaxID=276 RepID=A0A0D6XCL5_THEFI|nr:anthranilate phosphoribosyltransferase [Thermus filiformis]KIX84618.1 anthranilate phosphoribosyltransferase [Thermus filiformis]
MVVKALSGERLTEEEAYSLMQRMMAGELSPVETAGVLVALRTRGETPEEIAGFARAMREAARRVEVRRRPLLDIVGTGGDHQGTLNLSTAAGLVAAAGGVAVAKHGNRAATSKAGSADTLEALGVNIEAPPERMAEAVEEVGFGFFFARLYHPAMRHVAPVRAELKVRTVFNLLGPLTNPAGATHYVLGVFSPDWLFPMAEALERLGARGLVVHGEGADELVLGENQVLEVGKGRYTLRPEEVGLEPAPLEALRGGGPEENARLLRRLLKGEEKGPLRQAVALNAGAAFYVAGRAASLQEGVRLALEVLEAGAAYEVLERLVRKLA